MFQAQSSLLAFQATKLVQSQGFLCNHDPAISSPAAPTDTSETPPKKTSKPKKGPRGGVYDPFPLKLHRMLKYAALENLEDIVSWMPHGRAFKIHDSKVFASTIMPKFFNQSKYTSFQRQLNLYGFNRCSRGRDSGAYHHELFLYGQPELAKTLIRTKVKGNGHKTMKLIEADPDFYSMAYVKGNSSGSVAVTSASPEINAPIPADAQNQEKEAAVGPVNVETFSSSSISSASSLVSSPSDLSPVQRRVVLPVEEQKPKIFQNDIIGNQFGQPLRAPMNLPAACNVHYEQSYSIPTSFSKFTSSNMSPRSNISTIDHAASFGNCPLSYPKIIHQNTRQHQPIEKTSSESSEKENYEPNNSNAETIPSPFLKELNQSIFIHELAMGCSILCSLRKDTTKL